MKRTLSYSSIKEFQKSPAHFISYINREKKSTPAMELGTAIHKAVLENEDFYKEYQLCEHRKNTIKYKEKLKEGKKLLNNSDWHTIGRIVDSIEEHNLAKELLDKSTRFEFSIEREIKGLPFKGIIDIFGNDYIADLKTTTNGSPQEFERSCYNFKYYLQAAIYLEMTGKEDFWIITAETTAPYNVTPYKLDNDYIERGRRELYYLIQKYKEWLDCTDGNYTGYDYDLEDEKYFILKAPKWAK
tara:strand:+ start:216 stop:944 length:729 start_codon:yes stop_codon:yes gene_type:complete